MAQIYSEAFAGPPWFEVYTCLRCGSFSKTNESCVKCSNTQFSEDYPKEWFINEYIDEMTRSYIPGVVILAKDSTDDLAGFSTGGGISLIDLIKKKYKGNRRILDSINFQT